MSDVDKLMTEILGERPNVKDRALRELVMARMKAGGEVKAAGGGIVRKAMKEIQKAVEAEKKASEALGKVEGKTLMVTESDRTKVGQGYLGGPGFSSLQLTDPAYRDVGAVWGVAAPGKATTILNASRRVPEGQHVFTTMVGSPTQHKSNQQVFNKLLDEFRASAREGNLSEELQGRINDSLRSAINKEGNPIFAPNVDIMSPKFRKQASTFERRAVAADLIAGEGIGGKKGQIIDFDKVMRRTTDPMLLDVPTGSMGPRLFTLSGETIQRPDLHPAFPSILTGEDLGVAFQPAPIELMFRDYVKNLMETKGRKPGYMDITRGHGPKQFISEDLLTEMQKAGYAKGGSIDLEAEYRMGKGGLLKKAVKAVKEAIKPTAPQDEALRIAQKNAAKSVSEGGLGLPPDNTPMDRARAMGFVGAYHGTADDVVKIDPTKFGSSTGAKSAQKAFWAVDDPLTARGYSEFAAKDSKVKKLLDAAEDAGNKGDWDRYDYLLMQAEKLESELIKNPLGGQNIMPLMVRANQGVRGTEMNAKGSEFVEIQDELNKFLTKASKDNRDLAIIRNLSDAPGRVDIPATHFAAVNPSIVRSRFAAFDPARIDENDLLAGFAALGITAPMLTSEEPEYRSGGPVKMAGGGGIGKNVGRGMAGLTRSRQPLDPKEIQAMMLDVPAGVGVPFAEAGSYALRGETDEAKESAAIEAALIGVPGAAVLAKPAYRAVKKGVQKAAPAVREAARDVLESGMESGAIVDPRMQAIAYHGTPYKFEKFDASKIGTGEGAQAYGHGIYFAESPEVAKGYQKELATEVTIDDKPYFTKGKKVSSTGDQTVDDFLTWHLGDVGKAIEAAKRMGFDEYIPKLEALKDRVKKIQGGHLYTVDIPDESVARMLDWDKPLSGQPDAVQKSLSKADIVGNASYFIQNPNQGTFGEMYRSLENQYGAPAVSEFLKSQGIPGIKYLDAGSRSAGEGTRNFVVFPGEEDTVKILERKKRGGNVGALPTKRK